MLGNRMNKLFDFIYIHFWDILLSCFLFVLFISSTNCKSVPQADTIRIQERSENVIEDLDKVYSECVTDECRSTMKEAKELIKDSLDLLTEKDSEIKDKQEKIESESFYATIGKFLIWGVIAVIFIFFIWMFRGQILSILKIVI